MIHGCPSISTSVTIRGPFLVQDTEHLSSTGSTENDNRIPRYSYPWILQGKNSKQNAKIDEPLKPLQRTAIENITPKSTLSTGLLISIDKIAGFRSNGLQTDT